jgi:Sodium:neurotransmitter symporter family
VLFSFPTSSCSSSAVYHCSTLSSRSVSTTAPVAYPSGKRSAPCSKVGGADYLFSSPNDSVFDAPFLSPSFRRDGSRRRYKATDGWKRLVAGIGFGICIIATYMAWFYNTIIAWAVYFLFHSFRADVPWRNCNNSWNTPECSEDMTGAAFRNRSLNSTGRWVSPTEEYFL